MKTEYLLRFRPIWCTALFSRWLQVLFLGIIFFCQSFVTVKYRFPKSQFQNMANIYHIEQKKNHDISIKYHLQLPSIEGLCICFNTMMMMMLLFLCRHEDTSSLRLFSDERSGR